MNEEVAIPRNPEEFTKDLENILKEKLCRQCHQMKLLNCQIILMVNQME